MNEPNLPYDPGQAQPTREEIISSIFASMVIQTSNMAMIMLGKAAHPETGQFYREPESAKMMIDQLDMLEVKTRGNLSPQESALMKKALAAVRKAFIDLVGGELKDHFPETEAESATQPQLPSATLTPEPAPSAVPAPTAPAPPAATMTVPPQEESRKRFTKKY